MTEIKRLKGGCDLFVSEDEKLLVTSNCKNSVYVHDLETKELILQTRTVSNVSQKAVSPDKKLLAAKNTRGEIAVISMESGEELFRNKMERCEGFPIAFSEDSKYILDFDWCGRTMALDVSTGKHEVLDGPLTGGPSALAMRYDRYSKQVCSVFAGVNGYDIGVVLTSPADPLNFKYRAVNDLARGLPEVLTGISYCRTHNYFLRSGYIVVTDKKFNEVDQIPLPEWFRDRRIYLMKVSPSEKYIFFKFDSVSILYDRNLEMIQRFTYDYIDDFTMIDDDSSYIISTWKCSYIGDL